MLFCNQLLPGKHSSFPRARVFFMPFCNRLLPGKHSSLPRARVFFMPFCNRLQPTQHRHRDYLHQWRFLCLFATDYNRIIEKRLIPSLSSSSTLSAHSFSQPSSSFLIFPTLILPLHPSTSSFHFILPLHLSSLTLLNLLPYSSSFILLNPLRSFFRSTLLFFLNLPH